MSTLKEEITENNNEIKKRIKSASPVKLIVLAVLIIGTICSYVFYDFIYGSKNGWCTQPDFGNSLLNDLCKLVPVVISCIQAVTIILLISTVLVAILRKVGNKTQRGITVSSLACNLINWLSAIIMVIAVLAIFGVDTTALITGAGVVTLVIGLGMQSLIADVVAGLFIVFENEFNVGDWITVGDFRGQVISIGIRTTKLKAAGNVKILNNNAIQGVLNHTLDTSLAKTFIDVTYGAELPKVEKVIKENISKLEIPGAIGEVSYDGVDSLGASGVTLQFSVNCYEGDIFAVTRAMNGAIKNMFDQNGIDIPFPQIVVHSEN